jgi:hypothetical protein
MTDHDSAQNLLVSLNQIVEVLGQPAADAEVGELRLIAFPEDEIQAIAAFLKDLSAKLSSALPAVARLQ